MYVFYNNICIFNRMVDKLVRQVRYGNLNGNRIIIWNKGICI